MYLHAGIVPALVLTSVLMGMFIMGYMLFRRWRSKMYLIFASSIAAALLLELILLVAIGIGSKPGSVGLLQSIVFPIAFISLQGGFFHIFNPKLKKQLYIFLSGIVVTILIAALSFFLNKLLVEIVLTIVNIGFTAYLFFWALPRLAKREKFLTTMILNGCTAIGAFLYSILELQLLLIASIALFFITVSVLFVILFDRIIDLMQAVSYSSVTDGLTGLYQKHYFKKKVNEAIAVGDPCTVLFSDIDNFKKLNDTQGHQMGDVMLVFAATIMKEVCEDIGIVGRYGGEEIVALITDRRSDPAIIAEKFRSRIEKESKIAGYYPITVSVGYSRLNEDVNDAEEFIRQADDAMYISKKSGKNRVTNFASIRDNPVAAAVAAASAAVAAEPNQTSKAADNLVIQQDIPLAHSITELPGDKPDHKAEEAKTETQVNTLSNERGPIPGAHGNIAIKNDDERQHVSDSQDSTKAADPVAVVFSESSKVDSDGGAVEVATGDAADMTAATTKKPPEAPAPNPSGQQVPKIIRNPFAKKD